MSTLQNENDTYQDFYSQKKQSFEFALYRIRKHIAYRKEIISKRKGGGTRELLIPDPKLMLLQRDLNKIFYSSYIAPNCVHSFIKKSRTIKTNAEVHKNKKVVINMDLEKFFDSINFGRIRGLFLAKPFSLNGKLATKYAQLTTYDNKLPQGAPSSPTLSNMICIKLDKQLIKFAKDNKFTYSRFADDLTFSTNNIKNLDTPKSIKAIQEIVESNGFKVNQTKTRVQTKEQRQIVTGLIVNKKVNLSKKYTNQIRSMLHSWYKEGIAEASTIHLEKYNKQSHKYLGNAETNFKNIVKGKIEFLKQIMGKEAHLVKKYEYIFNLNKNGILSIKDLLYLNEFEELNLEKESRLKIMFVPIIGSQIIHVEGKTDIIYLKSALRFFRKEGKFNDLRLRFIDH